MLILPLAQRIAGALSFSASQWRPKHINSSEWVAVSLQVDFESPTPDYHEPLLKELHRLLAAPYITDQWPSGAAVVLAAGDRPPDAWIVLRERWVEDERQLVWEVRFRESEAVFRGFFTL
jgi:hypothetical protein